MHTALFILFAAVPSILAASGIGHSTRYWDCCKSSCAWPGKAAVSKPVTTCNKDNRPIRDAQARSGCDNGGAFACANNSPFEINHNLAYGFAATSIQGEKESDWCCACYRLTFTSGPVIGKTMIVQSTNTGSDLSRNQFDLMIPGGGVGLFDGCSKQYGRPLPGGQDGGVSSSKQCNLMPGILKGGCSFRFGWFMNADNPNFRFERVRCPSQLTAITGCVRDDDKNFRRA